MKLKGKQTAEGMPAGRRRHTCPSKLCPGTSAQRKWLYGSVTKQNCLTWAPRRAETLRRGGPASGRCSLASFQVDPDKTGCSLSSPLPQNPSPESSLQKQLTGRGFAGHVPLGPHRSACRLHLPFRMVLCGLGASCQTWAGHLPWVPGCCRAARGFLSILTSLPAAQTHFLLISLILSQFLVDLLRDMALLCLMFCLFLPVPSE